MLISDSVVVITGGGSGIGAALARRFAADGAAAVIVSDRNMAAAQSVADEIGGTAVQCDVTGAASIASLVEQTIAEHGRIDLFCSNAGITTGVQLEDPDDLWHKAFEIHTMSHVYPGRGGVPPMIPAGRGFLPNPAAAAGLLTSPGDAPY